MRAGFFTGFPGGRGFFADGFGPAARFAFAGFAFAGFAFAGFAFAGFAFAGCAFVGFDVFFTFDVFITVAVFTALAPFAARFAFGIAGCVTARARALRVPSISTGTPSETSR